jgi:hypothetical protein
MGAVASAGGRALTEVDVKNVIGVLYDAEAERAFQSKATNYDERGRRRSELHVSWSDAAAFGEVHGLLDSKRCLLLNLVQFKRAREGLQTSYDKYFNGEVQREIELRPPSADGRGCGPLGDERGPVSRDARILL